MQNIKLASSNRRRPRRPSASAPSGHDADDLGIGGEPPKRLFGTGNPVVDAYLKDAATGPLQCHLRVRPYVAYEVRRLTGARLIVSLTAVFDLDAHRLPSFVCEAVVVPQSSPSVSPGRPDHQKAGQEPTARPV
ncbi:MAG TPA: hypothetical protein VGF29_16670, partial [Hyphomicrobiaceae bacterium]